MELYKNLLKEYNSGIIGYATIGIIGQSCIGSAAVMLIFMNNDISRGLQMIELFLVTILCMGFNGAVLAQQKGKIQFNILVLSVFTSILFIITNMI
ncbi:hypothetical protein [Dokdonia sp.]|uniref:hypothetical protein n=1 Tax=Dokdonia sp. TaxID=2024995 RepID=UPI003264C725